MEFLDFNAQKLDCGNRYDDSVRVDKFIIPFWIPIIPIDLVTKSLSDFAFLFQVNANIGRHYVHVYKEGKNSGVVSEAENELGEDYPRELESFQESLKIKEEQRDLLELKSKRDTLLGALSRWKRTAQFPYLWENAIKVEKDEIWSVEGERTFLFGPMLTAAFVLAESTSWWTSFGGSVLSLESLIRGNYRVSVRRVKNGNQDNVQVKFNTSDEKGIGAGALSKSLSTDITYGALMKDTSINIFAGAAMQMNRVDIFPFSAEIFLKNSSKSNFILEFDVSNPESRRLYNQVMAGDFRDVDSIAINDGHLGNPVSLVARNDKERRTLYTRSKFNLPFLFSASKTCQKDRYTERLMLTLENDLLGFQKINLVDDICHTKTGGLLKTLVFGATSESAGFGMARIDGEVLGDTSTGLVGTYSFADEKVSQQQLLDLRQDFSDLGVSEILETFDSQLPSDKYSEISQIDMRFSFFVGRNLFETIMSSDRNEIKAAIELGYGVDLGNPYKRVARKFKKRSATRKARQAFRLYKAMAKFDTHAMIEPDASNFIKASKSLLSALNNDTYAFATIRTLFALMAGKELGELNYSLSLTSPQLSAVNGSSTIGENSLALMESEFESVRTVFKRWANFQTYSKRELEGQWFSVSSFSGKEGELPRQILEDLSSGERNAQLLSYECDCQFANQDRVTRARATVSGIAIKEFDEERLSPRTYGRALNLCLRASQDYTYKDKKLGKDIHFIKVPLNSCKVKSLNTNTRNLVAGILSDYQSVSAQIEEILSRETTCDKAMIFRKTPNILRKGLSAILGGYGWRIRGGGFEEELEGIPVLDGNMATITMSSLVSYVSANSCEDFIAGVKASALLGVGGVPGWGECFDMGNDKKHWRGEPNEKYFHDLPCMTLRTNFTTSMMASYLESKGYDYDQTLAGPSMALVYLITKQYDPELWKDIVVENTSAYEPFAISHRIGLSEFILGMVYGYTLSDSLLKGRNGEYIKDGDK